MDASDPLVIAVAGPNGAGKTTLAPFLLRDRFGVTEYVNADAIALGLSAFRPEGAAFEAARIMLSRVRALADVNGDFAFETTLATRSYAAWLEGLKGRGYSFHLLFLCPRRLSAGVTSGGHATFSTCTNRWLIPGCCMIIPFPGTQLK